MREREREIARARARGEVWKEGGRDHVLCAHGTCYCQQQPSVRQQLRHAVLFASEPVCWASEHTTSINIPLRRTWTLLELYQNTCSGAVRQLILLKVWHDGDDVPSDSSPCCGDGV